MENKRLISYNETELVNEYPFCYKKVPCGKFLNGDIDYAYHSCPLRIVDRDDGYSTTYQCKIDGGDASLNTPCRHYNLFNNGLKLVKKEYIK